jgi:glycerol-3-phosphate dehydrogenase
MRDHLSGSDFDIQSRIVVNSVGAWTDTLLEQLHGYKAEPKFNLSIAFNLLTDKIIHNHAVGFPSSQSPSGSQTDRRSGYSQTLFIIPWRNFSILGTKHLPYQGSLSEFKLGEEDVRNFIREINQAYSGLNLNRDQVRFVHHGFLPAEPEKYSRNGVKLVRDCQIYDHKRDGIEGVVTVVGVKYTTARLAAEKVVNLLFQKFGSKAPRCITSRTPIKGGEYTNYNRMLKQALTDAPAGLSEKTIEYLVRSYGTQYQRLYDIMRDFPHLTQTIAKNSKSIRAEIFHSVNAEMAQSVADIIQRRTELWMDPGREEVEPQYIANMMAAAKMLKLKTKQNSANLGLPFPVQVQETVHVFSD